jgi:hypothetical protein
MALTDEIEGLRPIDPAHRRIVVVFNATKELLTYAHSDFEDASFTLHPVQVSSKDRTVSLSIFDSDEGRFTVPARTTAVFVEGQ